MRFLVRVPANLLAERAYAAHVLLSEFLGLKIDVRPERRTDTLISRHDGSPAALTVADGFFENAEQSWGKSESLPRLPLATWIVPPECRTAELGRKRIEVLYGKRVDTDGYVRLSSDRIDLGLDVFGSAFFMLTRYEEVVVRERDAHGRFPAPCAVSERAGFSRHPIVNEYTEILWQCIRRLWPSARRKERASRVLLTHDVDVPFSRAGAPWPRVLRQVAGDLIQRGVAAAYRRASSLMVSPDTHPERDWCYSFPFICSVSEHYGLRSAFNFFGLDAPAARDCFYRPTDAPIQTLIGNLAERGHELGFHASYEAADSDGRVDVEWRILRDAAAVAGVTQAEWGGRHHFLRWKSGISWAAWENAGFAYDSSVGFAEQPGFRCGTCYEFPVFDLGTRRSLSLRERPLTVMDVSLFSPRYLGMRPKEARAVVLELASECRRYDGDFVLLWHNDTLLTAHARRYYANLIRNIAGV